MGKPIEQVRIGSIREDERLPRLDVAEGLRRLVWIGFLQIEDISGGEIPHSNCCATDERKLK
jgi:hypothetical protein